MDVVDNAISSAFGDPRFSGLRKQEFAKIKISISVLTKPIPFPVSGPDDLLKKLVAGKHGLILKQGWARATFLPAVWEELPDKEQFLSQLSMKAGSRLTPGRTLRRSSRSTRRGVLGMTTTLLDFL